MPPEAVRQDANFPERFRVPEVARRAANFIVAVEAAPPGSPVSLDMLVAGRAPSAVGALTQEMIRADGLYDRYDELVFGDNLASLRSSYYSLDLMPIVKLAQEAIDNVKTTDVLRRSAAVGLAVLQLSESGARAAERPSLLAAGNPGRDNDIDSLIKNCGTLAEEVFAGVYADRITGDINKIPLARHLYAGFLVDRLHALLLSRLTFDGNSSDSQAAAIQKLLPQFPAKTFWLNSYAYHGGPERSMARRVNEEVIENFRAAMESGESGGAFIESNVGDVVPTILATMDAAYERGATDPEQRLQTVARNSHVIGRLTERVTLLLPGGDKQLVRLSGPIDNLELEIDFPERGSQEDNFPELIKQKLQTRDRYGGICPARNPVRIAADGPTHRNLLQFGAAFEDRIGVRPPIMREIAGEIYVDLAALTVNYALFGVAYSPPVMQ